jgi:hypothetical protein
MSEIRKQLEDLVSEIFPREEGMTDAEHRLMATMAMQAMGGLDALEAAVQVGVANGHSVEAQLDIVRRAAATWRLS